MQDDQYVEQLRERFNSGDPMKFMFFWGHERPAKRRLGIVLQPVV